VASWLHLTGLAACRPLPAAAASAGPASVCTADPRAGPLASFCQAKKHLVSHSPARSRGQVSELLLTLTFDPASTSAKRRATVPRKPIRPRGRRLRRAIRRSGPMIPQIEIEYNIIIITQPRVASPPRALRGRVAFRPRKSKKLRSEEGAPRRSRRLGTDLAERLTAGQFRRSARRSGRLKVGKGQRHLATQSSAIRRAPLESPDSRSSTARE
jgi:hypothetical protein